MPMVNCQCASGNSGPASCFMKKSWPGIVGIHVDGNQGVGGWPSVMQREQDCQDAPRAGETPSAPPMQKSDWRKRPGPMGLGKQGRRGEGGLKEGKCVCSAGA